MSGIPEQKKKELETEQKWVKNRHYDVDWKRVDDFIKEKWPTGQASDKIDNDSLVTSTISTSSDSSVLVLSVGFHKFAYNTCSMNKLRPWLISQLFEENGPLARHITETWQEMAVPNGQRERVDTIAKHIVYDLTDHKMPPQMKALTCDNKANVRVRINQLKIWSHPRRDPPLDRVLEEKFGVNFKREWSNLKKYPKTIGKITGNDKIKQDVKEKRLNEEKEKFKKQFSKFYDYYRQLEHDKCIPTSYQFPTIQIALQTGDDEDDDRYGNTFTGYYFTHDNEVHLKFAVNNKLMAWPLPTMKEVFNKRLGDTGLVYGDFFQDCDPFPRSHICGTWIFCIFCIFCIFSCVFIVILWYFFII